MRRIGDIADIRTVSRVVISFEYYLPQEGKQPKRTRLSISHVFPQSIFM
jgi:hypothetical protein